MTTASAPHGLRYRRVAQHARPPAALLLVAGVVALLAAIPLAYLGVRALDGGLEALQPLFRARTLELILSTLALGLGVGAGAIGLGVPLAWLTIRSDLPGRRLWSVLTIAPLAIPSYLLAFAFVGAFAPRGWVAALLEPIGLGSPGTYGFGGAVVVLTLATMPYVIIATRAAMMRLDPATEEAARSLGSGPWSAARTAIVPVIVPAVGAGALLAMLYAVSDFGAVSILRYDTLATAIYSQYRFSFDRSGAAALALVLVAMALLLVWVEGRIRERAALRTPHGRRRVPRQVCLGHWRWPALAFCAMITFLALGIPTVTIATWLLNGVVRDLEISVGFEALRSSLLLGAGAAALAIVASLPLAHLIVHFPGRWSSGTERLLYGVYAIPGISLALAVVFFTLNVLPTLYQTLFALVLAVALRYLVQAVGALRGPMMQVSPRTVEAARSLGERPGGVLRTITLPLLRPGLVAGAALIFLSALKELPLTLLLAPVGFGTLATELWDAAREGFYAQAAVPAFLLLAVSFISVGLLVHRGDVRA
ncbi:MAG: ABC transporter permease [Chloroflexota bacterium]